MPGAASSTTMTWPPPSSTASWSAAATSSSTALRCARDTWALTIRPPLSHQLNRPEFPELPRRNFRNPQLSEDTVRARTAKLIREGQSSPDLLRVAPKWCCREEGLSDAREPLEKRCPRRSGCVVSLVDEDEVE